MPDPRVEPCRYCEDDAVGQDALGRDACEQHIESVEDDLVGTGVLERCDQGCCLWNAEGSVMRYAAHV
jgi:hypothetical protein